MRKCQPPEAKRTHEAQSGQHSLQDFKIVPSHRCTAECRPLSQFVTRALSSTPQLSTSTLLELAVPRVPGRRTLLEGRPLCGVQLATPNRQDGVTALRACGVLLKGGKKRRDLRPWLAHPWNAQPTLYVRLLASEAARNPYLARRSNPPPPSRRVSPILWRTAKEH